MYGLGIVPSKSDNSLINGVFGNANGDSIDDLKYLRNSKTVANSQDEFLESFKYFLTIYSLS